MGICITVYKVKKNYGRSRGQNQVIYELGGR